MGFTLFSTFTSRYVPCDTKQNDQFPLDQSEIFLRTFKTSLLTDNLGLPTDVQCEVGVSH